MNTYVLLQRYDIMYVTLSFFVLYSLLEIKLLLLLDFDDKFEGN